MRRQTSLEEWGATEAPAEAFPPGASCVMPGRLAPPF